METGQKRPLINELTQGKELANKLKNHLDTTMSAQTCEFLVAEILSSYEKALSMLNWGSGFDEVPSSFAEISPRTEVSDPADSPHHCNKNVFKKRKTMAKWSEQVKVCSGTMVEGPLSDGYSWRKYGQKDILGANHPRLETLNPCLFPFYYLKWCPHKIKVAQSHSKLYHIFF
nr:WRKY9381 [Atractylodes chinensis]